MHDLVDYASMESQKAGQSAATFAGAGKLPDQNIDVQPGNGIRYVVPQTLSGEEAVDFSMRVFSPGSDRYVVFRRGDKMVRRMKQTELDPAAMIRVRVRADRFEGSEGPLTVEVTD